MTLPQGSLLFVAAVAAGMAMAVSLFFKSK